VLELLPQEPGLNLTPHQMKNLNTAEVKQQKNTIHRNDRKSQYAATEKDPYTTTNIKTK
jgi:hypothetical protein